MAELAPWVVILRCTENLNHIVEVGGCRLDVDGHIVVPRQEPCEECAKAPAQRVRGLSRLEIRRWEKKLMQQIRDL